MYSKDVISMIVLNMFFLILISVLIDLYVPIKYQKEDQLVVLTNTDFKYAIYDHEFLFVFFHAPWCGQCKKIFPEFIDLGKKFQIAKRPVMFSKVDCTSEVIVCKENNIKGYPTLIFFNRGRPIKYKIEEEKTEDWVIQRTQFDSIEIEDMNHFNQFLEEAEEFIIIFFADNLKNNSEFQIYKNFGVQEQMFQILHISDYSLRKELKQENNKVVIFRKDNKNFVFKEKFTIQNLNKFVNDYSYSNVAIYNKRLIKKIKDEKLTALVMFTQHLHPKNYNVLDILEQLAPKNKQFIFCICTNKNNNKIFQSEAESLGLLTSTKHLPALMILQHGKSLLQKFKFTDKFNIENVQQFLTNFLMGKESKYVKSQELTLNEQNDIIRHVTAASFKKIINDSDKEVLLLCYTPWNHFTQRLSPIFDMLAQKLNLNPNIVIAKLDMTQNEIANIKLTNGNPMIKYYHKNKAKSEEVSTEKELEEFVYFLKQKTEFNWIIL